MLRDRIGGWTARWRQGALADAQCAAGYFLIWQIALHGSRFASRRSRFDARPGLEDWLAQLEGLAGENLSAALDDRLLRYQFRCVTPAVPVALRAWLQGRWALRLTERIPAPRDVLAMQVGGERPVTMLAEYPRMLGPVLSKANGFDFFLHDLEHAYKFFGDPLMHAGQRGFFAAISAALDRGCFADCLADAEFSARFDYLVSDMNTHIVHSLQYLRAILIERQLRQEGKRMDEHLSGTGRASVSERLAALAELWHLPPAARSAWIALADGGLTAADAAEVEQAMLAGAGNFL